MRWFFSLFVRSLLIVVGSMALVVAPLRADTYVYDDEPSTPIAFSDVTTLICNEPIYRTYDITDSFLVEDIKLGFNADHTYRSDIRLVLESPKGTRSEVIVEFDATPEDGGNNYDILLDDTVTDSLDDGSPDNTAPPYYNRSARPTNSFAPFHGERAFGTWILEICDAGVEDQGTYNRSRLQFEGRPIGNGPFPNTISGLVFRDYNADGAYKVRAEGGVPNIRVTAYDNAGATIATSVTDTAGEYTLTVPSGMAVRLEFDDLPTYLQPGPAGEDSATTVTFVTSPAEGIDVGLANPSQHAQNPDTMKVALPRYAYGAREGNNADIATMLSYREDDGSYALLNGDADTAVYDGDETVHARQRQTGAIWGVAYDRLHNQLLGAAFVKRHTDLGSTGNPTTIYRINPETEAASAWFTLDPARADPHGPNVNWVEDFAVYDQVGKEGWGDIDMSDDLRTLYGIDLGTRRLIAIPVQDDGSAGTHTGVDIIPALPANLIGNGDGQCPTADDLRPFGLGVNDGTLYLGVVCTAASTVAANSLPIQAPTRDIDRGPEPGNFDKMRAYIFAWNGDLGSPTFNQVIDFPLRYPRGCASYNQQDWCSSKYAGEWLPWVDQFPYSSDGTTIPAGTIQFESFYPQALVSNIEFTNGNMVIFVMDRFGHQIGPFTQSPYGEELNHVAGHSDILFACQRGDGWIMEATFSADPSCDTGIRAYIRGEERADEYFGEDTYRARFALHGDVGFGAGVAIPGRETVIHTVFDPIYATDVREDTLFDGGLHWYSIADGHWRKSLRIYNNITGIVPEEGIFSKANGLGDVVALTEIAPVEIGNRVWLDSNQDGIQSPSEAGIANVAVELLCPTVGPDGIPGNADDGDAVATAQTDPNGQYIFSSAVSTSTNSLRYGLTLVSDATCTVRIPDITGANQQAALVNYLLTEANDAVPTASSNDRNDSDGTLSDVHAATTITVGDFGMNNHTYDFGFFELQAEPHSLGNQVWFDSNDNAQLDGGELGVPGIALTLYATDTTPLRTTTTVTDGLYLFDNLPAGSYAVGVDASNFANGGALAGCRTSSETLDEDDPNLNFDGNDNGLLNASVVRSALLTLGADEPTGESPDNDPITPDNRENLTLDFGFFCEPPAEPHSLGNQVWFDSNDNAQLDGGELGVPGIALTLYATDTTPLRTTTTVTDGLYLFDNLPAGSYAVGVDASNFANGGALAGCRTSSETLDEDDPNLNFDGNDNGLLNASVVRSALLTLGADEPTGESPDNDPITPDNRENLTLDFGFYCEPPAEPHSLGNQVWFDSNDNAQLDGGELGVPGIALTLYATDTTPLRTTTTVTDGLYLFDNLPAGSYAVGVDASNFANGGALAGCRTSSETLDEDDPNLDFDGNDNGLLNASVVRSALLTLGADEPTGESPDNDLVTPDNRENLTLDFGFFCEPPAEPHSLGNQVWFDTNDNAQLDGGELGVPGIALTLYATDTTPLRTTTTVTDGLYLFDNLPAGSYAVGVDASNFANGGALAGCRTSSETLDEDDPNLNFDGNDNGLLNASVVRSALLTLGADEPTGESPDNDPITPDNRENLTLDFGFYCEPPAEPHSLGNQVWFDTNDNAQLDGGEFGIPGIALTLYATDTTPLRTTTTVADGLYLFDNLPAGSYAVGVDASNFANGGALAGCRTSSETLDEDDPNLNFDGNDNGLLNASVVRSALLTLGADEPTGESPDNDPITPDNRENLTLDFGFYCEPPAEPHSLGNQVWFDTNDNAQLDGGEFGIPGIALTLYATDTTPLRTTTTVTDGLYLFDNLPAGSYAVGVDASNFANGGALAGCRTSSETLDEDDPNLNFDGNDNGLLNASVVRSALLTLGADEPTGESPDNDPTTPDNRENLTLDFGFYCEPPAEPHSLGNQVWFDSNDNAQLDGGELGVPGIALTLYATDTTPLRTTTTVTDGLYLFDNLPAGSYAVGVDASNFANGGALVGCRTSSETLDEDDPNLDFDGNDNGLLNASVVRSALLTLGADEPTGESPDNDPITPDNRENLTLDFGFFCGHSLGNQVWFDANNNTEIDTEEMGIDDVALTLWTTNGTAVQEDDEIVAQTTTANGGLYLFSDLSAGEYYVQVDRSNFDPDGLLRSCLSSNERLDEDDPNLDRDNNDNGMIVGDFVRSGIVQLGAEEPLGETPDNDPNTLDRRENLSVDFGCYIVVSLGNRVWVDDGRGNGIADNGLADGSEPGLANVVLALLDEQKQPVLDINGNPITTTTDVAGYYLFTDLLPGNYVVQVLPSNFQTGGALAGHRSSSSTEEDPNQDGDTNDNGIDNDTPNLDGICSNVVTVTYTTEPDAEPHPGQLPDRALDSNSNFTVDFGFFPLQPTSLEDPTEPSDRYRFFLPLIHWDSDTMHQ